MAEHALAYRLRRSGAVESLHGEQDRGIAAEVEAGGQFGQDPGDGDRLGRRTLLDPEPIPAEGFGPAWAGQEDHRVSCLEESAAEIGADGAGAVDQETHAEDLDPKEERNGKPEELDDLALRLPNPRTW